MPPVRPPRAPASTLTTPGSAEVADVATRAIATLAGDTELSRVHYTFQSEADQAAQWLVVTMTLSEAVSSGYEAKVDLVSLEGDDASSLLGKPCVLTLERDESRRLVHGIVSQIAAGSLHADGTAVTLTVVPALQALAQRSDSRVFQDKTVPEVLELVLQAGLAPYQRKLESRLRHSTYPRREFVVQYRETDLAFLQRMMAEEGIWYFFEQREDDGAELLVLVDANEDAVAAQLGEAGEELPIHLESGVAAHWQTVTQFALERSLSATSVSVRAFNWTNPSVPELRTLPSEQSGERPLYCPAASVIIVRTDPSGIVTSKSTPWIGVLSSSTSSACRYERSCDAAGARASRVTRLVAARVDGALGSRCRSCSPRPRDRPSSTITSRSCGSMLCGCSVMPSACSRSQCGHSERSWMAPTSMRDAGMWSTERYSPGKNGRWSRGKRVYSCLVVLL